MMNVALSAVCALSGAAKIVNANAVDRNFI
jgi:hypothetical protein